jgi:hypothetical protein
MLKYPTVIGDLTTARLSNFGYPILELPAFTWLSPLQHNQSSDLSLALICSLFTSIPLKYFVCCFCLRISSHCSLGASSFDLCTGSLDDHELPSSLTYVPSAVIRPYQPTQRQQSIRLQIGRQYVLRPERIRPVRWEPVWRWIQPGLQHWKPVWRRCQYTQNKTSLSRYY